MLKESGEKGREKRRETGERKRKGDTERGEKEQELSLYFYN